MFMQSAAMALAFGSHFQYGKRKISSMTNEEFNKINPKTLNAELVADVAAMILSVEKSMEQMSSMNETIIKEMAKLFFQGAEELSQFLTGQTKFDVGDGVNYSVSNIVPNLLGGETVPSITNAPSEDFGGGNLELTESEKLHEDNQK